MPLSGCDPHLCTSERRASPAQAMTLHVGRTADGRQGTADASVIMIMSRMAAAAAPKRGGTIHWDCTHNDSARRCGETRDEALLSTTATAAFARSCERRIVARFILLAQESEREREHWREREHRREWGERSAFSELWSNGLSKQEQRVCDPIVVCCCLPCLIRLQNDEWNWK